MVDKNLFRYKLAIAAIFKDEGKYLREWVDYHLLAGVEHFYLYNNNSSDDCEEILAPYVEKNLVTLTKITGRGMQMPAYDDAIEKHRFDCQYMAFIDIDEFIFPRTGQSIPTVVDDILSHNPDAAAFGINEQHFGSNGEIKADYSRGVLERFTRRAPRDWTVFGKNDSNTGNIYIKSVANPRRIDYYLSPHFAIYFKGFKSINSDGAETWNAGNSPICADKIVVNHYFTKSREEFTDKKTRRGKGYSINKEYIMEDFYLHDRNEEFDDSILKYRAARADCFALESDAAKVQRVGAALIKTLTQRSPIDAPAEFLAGKLETFLTCRAVAEKLDIKIGGRSAEEYALVWIYQTLVKSEQITQAEIQQFMRALPEILVRPFPLCGKIKNLTQEFLIPSFCEALKNVFDFGARSELVQFQRFLRLIK